MIIIAGEVFFFFITMLLYVAIGYEVMVELKNEDWKVRFFFVALALGFLVMFGWACYGLHVAFDEKNYCQVEHEAMPRF